MEVIDLTNLEWKGAMWATIPPARMCDEAITITIYTNDRLACDGDGAV